MMLRANSLTPLRCFKIIIFLRVRQDLNLTLRRTNPILFPFRSWNLQIGITFTIVVKTQRIRKKKLGKQRNTKQHRYDGRIRIDQWERVSLKLLPS